MEEDSLSQRAAHLIEFLGGFEPLPLAACL
jgi:hypothetical protein